MQKSKRVFSPEDIVAIQRAVYGEAAGSDDDTMKMIAQSIINRANSGRGKEFGETIPDILNKGYYAVKSPNTPYKQALSGEFPDTQSKAAWGRAQKIVDIVLSEPETGGHQFYFTPEEEENLRNKKSFNFDLVKPMGQKGKFNLYGY